MMRLFGLSFALAFICTRTTAQLPAVSHRANTRVVTRTAAAALAALATNPMAACAAFGGTGTTPEGHVPSNAQLAAMATTQYPQGLQRNDFSVGLGAPPVFFAVGSAPCALHSGAGDGGSQVRSADGKCWLARFSGPADVREWGVKAVGAGHDDTLALTAALSYSAATHSPLWIPPNVYSATGVTVPPGAIVTGAITQGNPKIGGAYGSSISCPTTAAAPVCVTLGGAGTGAGKSAQLDGLIISGGRIDGLKLLAGFDYLVNNVQVQGGSASCLHLYSDGTNTGIHAKINNITLTGCTARYVDYDGWPELYGVNWRLGVNGVGDASGMDSFFYIHGGFASGGSGPNSIAIDGLQANPGGATAGATHFMHYSEIPRGPTVGPFIIQGGFLQAAAMTDIVQVDRSVATLPFSIKLDKFSCGCLSGENLFGSGAPVALYDFAWTNSSLTNLNVNLSGSTQYVGLVLRDLDLGDGALAINGAANSTGSVSDINSTGAFTLSGKWAALKIAAPLPRGTYTDTASGFIAGIGMPSVSYAPALFTGKSGSGWSAAPISSGWIKRTPDGGFEGGYNYIVGGRSQVTAGDAMVIINAGLNCAANYENDHIVRTNNRLTAITGTVAGVFAGDVDQLYMTASNGTINLTDKNIDLGSQLATSFRCSQAK